MTARIPFDHILIDKRHKAFAEGRRETPLTLRQLITARSSAWLFLRMVAAVFFIGLGGQSLVYDWSVEWKTANAVIRSITPSQYKNKINFWYNYSFMTEDGRSVSGKIVLSTASEFSTGASIPVVYVASDPEDNRYADESMPRSFRDWFFVVLGVGMLGLAFIRLRPALRDIQLMRGFAQDGQPVLGTVTQARWAADPVAIRVALIEYSFTPPGQATTNDVEAVPSARFGGRTLPEPGQTVAVWYMPASRTHMLL